MASKHRRAVGVFPDRARTASALQTLDDSGFSMSQVSVIARDPDRERAIAGVDVKGEETNRAEQGGTVGAVTGGVLGGVTGLLVGLGSLVIPGVGAAVLAGEAATVLTTIIGGAAGAVAGGLVGGLIGLGIPEHRAKHYRDRVVEGDYLVMLKGTEPEIARAERTLKAAGIEDWGVYESPAAADHQPVTSTGGAVNSPSSEAGAVYADSDRPSRLDEPSQMGIGYASRPESDSLNPTAEHTDAKAAFGAGSSDSNYSEQRAIGTFQAQEHLETALSELQQSGFPIHNLSVLVREVESGMPEERRIRPGSPLLATTGLTAEATHTTLPQIGSVLVVGPDADLIAKAANKNGDSTAKVLKSLGIAEESARLYSRHLSDGDYVVTLKGRDQEVLQAASTLGRHGMRQWGIYDVQPV